MSLKSTADTHNQGFALILALAFIALLVLVIVSFLGMSSRNVALSKVETSIPQAIESAEVASRQILQDLMSEIRAGSVEPAPLASSPILYPATPLSVVPSRISAESETAVSPPNLVKQSRTAKAFYAGTLMFNGQPVYPQASKNPVPPRTSDISTSGAPSVGLQRWNTPLLLPRAKPTSSSDLTLATNGTLRVAGKANQPWQWNAPDWVYLRGDGANALNFSKDLTPGASNPVVARYAYQMYDIGGLLDANVAGYDPDPLVVGGSIASRRGSIGLADLTQTGLSARHLKQLLAFRNQATLAASDAGPFGHRYLNFLLNNKNNLGFTRVSGGTSANVQNRAFTSRSHLVNFLKSLAATDTEKAQLLEALQSLTHFSRGLEQPSFRPGYYDPAQTGSTALSPLFTRPTIVPPAGRMDDILYPISTVPTGTGYLGTTNLRRVYKLPFEMALGNNRGGNDAWGTMAERGMKSGDTRALQDVINPAFLEVRTGTLFTRQDGSTAKGKEPLVKKRFPLERLAWVTNRGPSASLPKTDSCYNSDGTAQAILDCMGLTWMKDSDGIWFWAYAHGMTGGIFKLEELLVSDKATGRPREPDFFELLKAGIAAGSLGKSANATHFTPGNSWDPATYIQCRDRVGDFQLLEIGANLIDQYDADSFPTIIRLPNTDPALNSKSPMDPARYSPPLFTAKGIEDLPYFYRFHLRAIEDENDKPSPALPSPGGPKEITDNLAAYAGNGFKCGTTVIMGFPELWNPHALDPNKPYNAKNVPDTFRIVAVSETPRDVLAAPKDANDMGLATNPKMGNLPTADSSSQLWLDLANQFFFDFATRTIGFFGFTSPASTTTTLLPTPGLGTQNFKDTLPMVYQTLTQTWDWPMDDVSEDNLKPVGSSLYWSDFPSTKFVAQSKADFFLAGATLWKIPTLENGSYPLEPPPSADWPESLTGYKGKVITAGSLGNLPENGESDKLYTITTTGNHYTWTGGTYTLLTYPQTPRISDLALTHSYTVRPAPLTDNNGNSIKDPFSPYLHYRRALTDRPGVKRTLFQTSSTPKIPGVPASYAGFVTSRTIDLRGTEILFNVTTNSLFREPSTLCNVGLPKGSNLKAGPDNFFSSSPYNGSVSDSNGNQWIGISLGEVPTNFILLTKMFKKTSTMQSGSWVADSNGLTRDVKQSNRGFVNEVTPPTTPATDMRFFQIPVTTAGIDQSYFTLRLQFKDPNGAWVTYDERYLEMTNFSNNRLSTAPVINRNELIVSNPNSPQDSNGNVAWKQSSQALGWSMPLITSYDPRTPRFGNPVRHAYPVYQTVYGTNAQVKQALNSSNANPSALFPNGGAPTDRTGNPYVDLPSSSGAAMTITPRGLAPASWNSWFYGGGLANATYDDTYNYAAGIKAGTVYWWATGKTTTGNLLFKKPSPNALDYGWHPRLYKITTLAGTFPSTHFTLKPAISPDSTLPNFIQDASHTFYADSLRMGLLSENIAPSAASTTDPNAPYRQAYADPDDVIRRASGGLASSGGYTNAIEGLPLAAGSLSSTNRPIILNRPFRSVAEMGYAFRGTPWKNITFFLPETGDAALLDLFCLSEPPPLTSTTGATATGALPIVAGKVNLNTRQEPVLRALLAGALKDEFVASENMDAGTDAAKAANALIDRTTGTKTWQGPLTNVSELAGKLLGKDLSGISSTDPVYTATIYRTSTEPNRNPDMQAGKDQLTWHFTGYSADLDAVFGATKDRKTQRLRESAIRALADCGQTRVWNLMLDIIVQTGALTPSANSLANFRKETDQRLWVYLAIDRFTGEILEQKQEWVSE